MRSMTLTAPLGVTRATTDASGKKNSFAAAGPAFKRNTATRAHRTAPRAATLINQSTKGDALPERVLIIGWDGADWKVLKPMLDAGELPNLAALIERGAYGDCLSTVPSHSWCAWPTFMTGLNPAGHGVFDILE